MAEVGEFFYKGSKTKTFFWGEGGGRWRRRGDIVSEFF